MSCPKRCNRPRGFTGMGRRMLSMLLVLLMVVTMLPATAFAGEPTESVDKPVLTATANNEGNYVDLSWTTTDPSAHYMISQKDAVGNDVYQTIPAKSNIKVLNVYPDLSESGKLKEWMETDVENENYTMGSPVVDGVEYTMTVDKVSLSDFRGHVNERIKDDNGNYKYDVIYFGASDANNNMDLVALDFGFPFPGDESPQDTTTLPEVEAFLNYGGGVLMGHDTVMPSHPKFDYLAKTYLNMDTNSGNTYQDSYGSDIVAVSKKGLLTNFPYALGPVGTKLNPPYSHSYHQFAMGDVWFKYVSQNGIEVTQGPDNRPGTNNFYLTTWNNCAMVQTGHSTGQATTDEQKILANTLYYLAQVTTDTAAADRMSQDLAAPSAVLGNSVAVAGTSVTWTAAEDNGSAYTYKLKQISPDGSEVVESDGVSAEVKTGIDHYQVLINSNSSASVSDIKGNGEQTSSPSFDISQKNLTIGQNYYIHIIAVDKAGNESTVVSASFAAPEPSAVAPTISTQPADAVVAVGENATFSVAVSTPTTGNTYQWYSKSDGGEWQAVADATDAILTVGNTASSVDGMKYRCIVTNTVGETTESTPSNEAVLTLTYPATIQTTIDGEAASVPGGVELWKNGVKVVTAGENLEAAGTYAANVPNGTYAVYVNGKDTGKTVTISGAAAAADSLSYYTVSFHPADSGLANGSTITATVNVESFTSGGILLAGTEVVLTAADGGSDATSHTYLWSGTGTSGQTTNTITLTVNAPISATCTVTGSASYSVKLEANEGTINSGNITGYTPGAAVTLPTDVTRANATFAGWYTSSDFSGEPVTRIGAEETGTKTYHAKWTNSITYRLNYSGAGSYPSATALHGGTMTAPQTAPARNGYTFTGWYKDALGLDPWSFTDDTVTKDLTLYAGWAATVNAVAGTVADETPAPVSSASVTLMKGNTQFKSAVTDGTGQFTLTDVPDGSYNLVVSEGGKIVTTYVTVRNGILTPDHITMPGKKFSQLTVKGNDTPSVVADGLNNQFTATDEVAIGSGNTVKITLEVEKVTPSGTTASAIQTAAAAQTIDFYLDMTVYRQLNSDPATPLPTVQNLLKIMVPYDLTGKSNVTVYRYHGGQATALTRITSESNSADGTYLLDTANHQIIIWAQNFSTYAVAYTTGGDQGNSGHDSGGSSGNSGTSPSRTITVAETSSSLFKGSTAPVRAEANMTKAFTNSVEVKVTDTADSADSFGLGSGVKVYPFDISFYIKGTNTKTQPAEGYAVTISLPVPENLLSKKEQLFIANKENNGVAIPLNSRLTQVKGVWYLVFEVARFSPYALAVKNVPDGNTPAVSDIPERIYGQSRYDTAVEIAKAYFPAGTETVILARGDVSADALPAASLAKKYNAPLLLTPPDSLPDQVLAEIKRLGAKKVIITGGTGAVKPAVEEKLKEGLGSTAEIERIYGPTHYETAYEIAKRLGSDSGQAVLVNGDNYQVTYPDVLSVASWAANHGVPILYGDSTLNQLPEATAKAMAELKVTGTLLIGGTAVLPEKLAALVPGAVRYGGTTLYDTNVEVLKNLQPNPLTVYAVTGKDFADALAGAAVAAQNNGWLLLTGGSPAGLTSGQEDLLKSVEGGVKEFHVLGGPAAVPEASMETIKKLLGLN